WDVTLVAGKPVTFSLPEGSTTILVVRHGRVRVGESEPVGAAECAICSREGSKLTLTADENAELLLLNGEPIGEPVVGYGPFVMNTQAEIRQAITDFQEGRLGRL